MGQCQFQENNFVCEFCGKGIEGDRYHVESMNLCEKCWGNCDHGIYFKFFLNFPIDCYSVIISFFDIYEIQNSFLLINKFFHELIMRKTLPCPFLIRAKTNNIQNPKPYVGHLICGRTIHFTNFSNLFRNLKHLELDVNRQISLGNESFKRQKRLEILEINAHGSAPNRFDGSGFRYLRNLRKLALRQRSRFAWKEWIDPEHFSKLISLEELHLYGFRISEAGDGFKGALSRLSVINFDHVQVEPMDLYTTIFKAGSQIKRLELKSCCPLFTDPSILKNLTELETCIICLKDKLNKKEEKRDEQDLVRDDVLMNISSENCKLIFKQSKYVLLCL